MPKRAWGHGLVGLLDVWRSSGKPLIHVNGRRGNSVAFAARLTVRGFRFVATVHGVLGHDRRNLIYRLVDLAAGRAARAVIAVSADTRRRLVAAGSPAGRTFVIGNGLAASDLEDLRRVAATRAGSTLSDQLRIGFLGRPSPEKGTTELVTVARALAAADAKAVLAFAGHGPDRDWMKRATAAPDDRERIRWYGTDPSLGVVVAPRDVDAMVEAWLVFANQPARARQIGAAASQHVALHHALADRVVDIKRAYGWTSGRSGASIGGADTR